jgi:hypothetical protein
MRRDMEKKEKISEIKPAPTGVGMNPLIILYDAVNFISVQYSDNIKATLATRSEGAGEAIANFLRYHFKEFDECHFAGLIIMGRFLKTRKIDYRIAPTGGMKWWQCLMTHCMLKMTTWIVNYQCEHKSG